MVRTQSKLVPAEMLKPIDSLARSTDLRSIAIAGVNRFRFVASELSLETSKKITSSSAKESQATIEALRSLHGMKILIAVESLYFFFRHCSEISVGLLDISLGIAESFQAQTSSHQIRLPQDSAYKKK